MELIDILKHSKCHGKCCSRETITSETSKNNESFYFDGWQVNEQPNFSARTSKIIDNVRDENSTKILNPLNLIRRDCKKRTLAADITYSKYEQVDDYVQEEAEPSQIYIKHAKDEFRCPRCGRRMHEPKLLPCLHPICSSCIHELTHQTEAGQALKERCPLCDFPLPKEKLDGLPPHYPLQHKLVMNALKCRLVRQILCDTCYAEVLASVQCSVCLKNFCQDCGMKHQDLSFSKHIVKPLWKATRIRRTVLCPLHNHVLRFYCIACQQITCKECIWSLKHRGHATESATSVSKRVSLYLKTMLQRAKEILNSLLIQYDREVFDETPGSLRSGLNSMAFRYFFYLLHIFKKQKVVM
ncbi:tripartite motif-containing protein 42-like [Prorops nasuta]|uniref:tripartite motif-containing protein 42-like n=1 Tax=Prorops nasuta TaxID=863751 RepID=UPI0034CE9994